MWVVLLRMVLQLRSILRRLWMVLLVRMRLRRLYLLLLIKAAHAGQGEGVWRRTGWALAILVHRLASRVSIGVLSRSGLAGRSAVRWIVSSRRRIVYLMMWRGSMLGLRVLVLVLMQVLVRMLVRLARWADLGRRMGHGRRRRGRDW